MLSPAAPNLTSSACRVVFGDTAGVVHADASPPWLSVALEILAGGDRETLLSGRNEVAPEHGFCLFHGDGLVGGFTAAAPDRNLETATRDIYRRLFAVTAGLHLYRIWNYVPAINAGEDELEYYHHFCRGRSLAFEEHFGKRFQLCLPAASAVGTSAGPLTLAFLAGRSEPRHFENPRQVPAFQYPSIYGSRPPSFSRATVVPSTSDPYVFVAGTAAIRGHATIAPGDLDAQLGCTLENLQGIGEACGVGASLGAGGNWQRIFKIYLRHREDLPRVIARVEDALLRPDDQVVYLRADICRVDLVVEIETRLVPR